MKTKAMITIMRSIILFCRLDKDLIAQQKINKTLLKLNMTLLRKLEYKDKLAEAAKRYARQVEDDNELLLKMESNKENEDE